MNRHGRENQAAFLKREKGASPRRSLILPAVAVFLAFIIFAPKCLAEVRNMTEENKKALSEKVLELRHTELMRVSRGRLKSSPILLPMFDAYQILTQDQGMLLEAQLEDYRAALIEMDAARRDFAIFNSSQLGRDATAIFYKRLAAAYSLKPRIEKLDTLWLVWREITISRARLQSLPVEYRLALNAGKWLSRMPAASSAPPPEITERYIALCGEEPSPSNVFEADKSVSEISAKYSRLFADLAAMEKK